MKHEKHALTADPYIVETWVKGWSLAREVPSPVKYKDGYKVDVGWPKQRVRYVFPSISKEYLHLANTISTPWSFLKVCASPIEVSKLLPPYWIIQPLGFMMTNHSQTPPNNADLPKGYSLHQFKDETVPVAKIISNDGEVAAIGRIVFVRDFAIYDRIETHLNHRRKGLASAVMSALYEIGREQGIKKGVLVATAEGKSLYESLGWQLHSPYTTAVILGYDD